MNMPEALYAIHEASRPITTNIRPEPNEARETSSTVYSWMMKLSKCFVLRRIRLKLLKLPVNSRLNSIGRKTNMILIQDKLMPASSIQIANKVMRPLESFLSSGKQPQRLLRNSVLPRQRSNHQWASTITPSVWQTTSTTTMPPTKSTDVLVLDSTLPKWATPVSISIALL